jgi:hypothetical protein
MMNYSYDEWTFKRIFREKRGELFVLVLIFTFILTKVAEKLINAALQERSSDAIFTTVYSLNLFGVLILAIPSTFIGLLLLKGFFTLKVRYPNMIPTRKVRKQKEFGGATVSSANSFTTFNGNGLLEELKYTRNVVASLNESNRYVKGHTNYRMFKSKFFNVLFGVLFYLLCYTFLSFPPIAFLLNLFGLAGTSIVQIALLVGTIFVTIRGKDLVNQFITQKRMQKHQFSLNEKIHLRRNAHDYLSHQQTVPDHYLNVYALDQLINIVKRQRAQTIQDAIHIYENDEHYKRQERILRRIQGAAMMAKTIIIKKK